MQHSAPPAAARHSTTTAPNLLWVLCCLAASIAFSACSSPSVESGGNSDAGTIATDTGLVVDEDAGTPDAGGDNDVPAIPDATDFEDTGTDTFDAGTNTECPGAPGCDCVKNDDCDNAVCLDHADGKKCAKPCVDSCPTGFTCKQIGASDIVFMCAPNYVSLCSPCEKNDDCKVQGTDSLCIDYGKLGKFCGGLCSKDEDCPTGYGCVDAFDQDKGSLSKQCKLKPAAAVGDGGACTKDSDCADDAGCADNGKCGKLVLPTCGCSTWATAVAKKTSCMVTNEFGSCPGQRQCGAGGMGACTGGTPAKEACDGIDNDCDGDTDNEACDDGDACTKDACEKGKCSHKPTTDCEDGDPCTTGKCAPETGKCVMTPAKGSCDDNNACTEGDACGVGDDGKAACLPGATTKACDDTNACTNDACDANKGCVYLPNAATQACYTGHKGTEGVGICKAGVQLCVNGQLSTDCKDQVKPGPEELCDGKDNTCDGTTDEGCKPTGLSGQFSGGGGRLAGNQKGMIVSVAGEGPVGTATGKTKTLQAGFIPWLLSKF
ncbi:MAG: hypothetical protein KC502_02325 [Myxococcales bacterium]|nr:hypothetical protein [Myxococcales bacterium]